MKRMISLGISALLLSPLALAAMAAPAQVTLSPPLPSIPASYGAGITNTVIYTVTNTKNNSFPFTLSGISGAVTRTTVTNDCGNTIPSGPSTCNIGIAIKPTASQIGTTVTQSLELSYTKNNKPLTAMISFKVINPYAYIANYGLDSVMQCLVDPATGLFNASDCQDSGAGSIFSGPTGMAISSFGGAKFAYVVNNSDNSITRCSIDSTTGQFSFCSDSGAGNQFGHTYGITFYSTKGGSTYAYVPKGSTNQVLQCSVDLVTGLLGTCADSGAGPVFPGQFYQNASVYVAFNTIGGRTYVYVTESNNGSSLVTQCLVNTTTGQFTNCNNVNMGFLSSGIAFTQVMGQSIAYLAGFNSLYTCSVDSLNGLLSCANPITMGWGQLIVATVGGNNVLYSANGFATNDITQCQITSPAGALTGCQSTGIGATYYAPFAIVLS